MTYEITIETSSNSHSTRKQFPSMTDAIAWAKDFAADWWRGAGYSIFCVETEAFEQGDAN